MILDAEPDDNVGDPRSRYGLKGGIMQKGAKVKDDVGLIILSSLEFSLSSVIPGTGRELRAWRMVRKSAVISLAELCEWYGECDLEEACRHERLSRMVNRWKKKGPTRGSPALEHAQGWIRAQNALGEHRHYPGIELYF